MIGKAAVAHPQRADPPVDGMGGHQQQAAHVQLEFLGYADAAVRAEIAIVAVSEHHEPMVQRAVKHVLAHVAPVGGGQRGLHVGHGQRLLHLRDGHGHQPRIAVGAAAFVGDPIGAHVAFFKHMHRDPAPLGLGHGGGVDRAGVAVQHDVGDLARGAQVGKGLRPILGAAAIGDIAGRMEPERTVARVKADTAHGHIRAAQHFSKTVEKWSVRALQKQENAMWIGGAGHLSSDTWFGLSFTDHSNPAEI